MGIRMPGVWPGRVRKASPDSHPPGQGIIQAGLSGKSGSTILPSGEPENHITTDSNPPELPPDEPPEILPVAQHKDRRGGLIAFGVAQIFLGLLCALFVGLMVVGQTMAAQSTGGSPNFRMLAFSFAFYGVMAVILVWLGLGSIRTRRWARALSLVLAWSWLLIGIVSVVFSALLLPQMMRAFAGGNAGPPPIARLMMVVIPLVILGIFFIVVPGSMVLFYQSKHVQATCEARDPARRWTDACPLPVLAVSLWLGFGALSMLFMPWAYHGVMPFFGILLSGVSGSLMLLAMAGLWSYAAWAFYRLKATGWWVVFITLAVFSVSSVVTFLQVDIKEMYQLMGVPEEQIRLIGQFPLFKSKVLAVWTGLSFGLVLGYLLYVKRFFQRSKW